MSISDEHIKLLSCSPFYKFVFPFDEPPPCFRPYGGSSLNVLNYFLGTPEIVTEVGEIKLCIF